MAGAFIVLLCSGWVWFGAKFAASTCLRSDRGEAIAAVQQLAVGQIGTERPASPKSAAGAVKARKKTVSVVFENQRDVALGKPGGANGRDWILVRRRE